MPATRSQSQNKLGFRTVKRNKSSSKKSPKKIKRSPSPVEVVSVSSDESTSQLSDLVMLEPGTKLDVTRYRKYHRSIRPKIGPVKPIHAEHENLVHQILRTFDLTYEYGPCVGVSRLARWERAQKLGLNPPMEVKEILETEEGEQQDIYAQNVFFSEGV